MTIHAATDAELAALHEKRDVKAQDRCESTRRVLFEGLRYYFEPCFLWPMPFQLNLYKNKDDMMWQLQRRVNAVQKAKSFFLHCAILFATVAQQETVDGQPADGRLEETTTPEQSTEACSFSNKGCSKEVLFTWAPLLIAP
jgi:hypothetical protein